MDGYGPLGPLAFLAAIRRRPLGNIVRCLDILNVLVDDHPDAVQLIDPGTPDAGGPAKNK